MREAFSTDRLEALPFAGQRHRELTDGAISLADQLMSQMEHCHCPMLQMCQECQSALSRLKAIGFGEPI